ncbi:hypothetical protein PHYSODRAFT_391159, partial [Phytophthora sojae]
GLRRRVARVHFNNAETRLATHLLVHDQRSRLQYRQLLSAKITAMPHQGGSPNQRWATTLNTALESA